MHNLHPQLGRYSPQLGCTVYEERAQLGEALGFSLSDFTESVVDSVKNAVKQAVPGISETATNEFLKSQAGQDLLNKTQETAYTMGEQAAAAQAAQQTLAMRQQLEAYYQGVISNLRQNWKTYLIYGGIALATLVGGYMIFKRMNVTSAARANPRRRKRRFRRRK
jgi:hypothetical protein